MIANRFSLFLAFTLTTLALLFSFSLQLHWNVQQQQNQLVQYADDLSSQLSSTLPVFISYNDRDAIVRIVEASLTPHVKSLTLVDLITSEQATWSGGTVNTPTSSLSFATISPIERQVDLRHEGIPIASLAITVAPNKETQIAWLHAIKTLGIHAVYLFITLSIAAFFIGRQRRAIRDVAQTLTAMSDNGFLPLKTSKRSGIATLDHAMEYFGRHAQRLLQSSNSELKRLRKSMMFDAVSGLYNKQYFIHQLNSWMDEGEDTQGAVFIIQVDWLEHVYRQYGYSVRDETWRLLSHSLQDVAIQDSNACLARFGEKELAIFLPEYNDEESRKVLHAVISALNNEAVMAGFSANKDVHIGVVHAHGKSSSDMLSFADNALQHAIEKNEVFIFHQGTHEHVIAREAWRELLSEAIDKRLLRLKSQPVYTLGESASIFHREVFTQTLIEHTWHSAGRIMPYINFFSKGADLDRAIIETLIQQHHQRPIQGKVALNLSTTSLRDGAFIDWLCNVVRNTLPSEYLHFEISEASARADLNACLLFSKKMKACGVSIGIDHFGRYLESVEYLAAIKPHYVKLDQAFTQTQSSTNQLFTITLANIAESLNITVIATGVKNTALLERLDPMLIHAYQGFIHPPTLIIEDELQPQR
ncbi:EAL domain-containing protein [Enterovibrio norvegicus]|uniref:EAL domain-containing protein n=1 Tax=Enterovibrio norvegicus TaxID=188144 RepID=UPI0013D027DF|nr:EAL domain-containing protein [Enterovibrio norvegicus]